MQFAVRLANSGPLASREAMRTMAVAAEQLGFDAVSIHDHVNWGWSDRYHFYVGAVEQADATDNPLDFYSAFATLGYLAGITSRVRLVPAALCLAWRHPLQVAREALTMHALSRGRFVLCVCVGNVQKDFEATGTPWEKRGQIAVEGLKVLRSVMDATGPVSFQGEYFRFERADLHPLPRGLRMWYAGTSDVAIRRAARYGEGWMPAGDPAYFHSKVPELRRHAERYGRAGVQFEVATVCRTCVARTDEEAWRIGRRTLESELAAEWLTRHDIGDIRKTWLVGSPERIAGRIREYEAAGVTMIGIGIIAHTLAGIVEQLELFAKEVIPLAQQ